MENGSDTISQAYFSRRPKQLRVADLEQSFVAGGYQQPEAARMALTAFEAHFSKQMKNKGVKVLIFLVCAALFLVRIIQLFDQSQNVTQLSFFLLATAYTLVQGLIWGMQLFQLKEEISSFRELRKL